MSFSKENIGSSSDIMLDLIIISKNGVEETCLRDHLTNRKRVDMDRLYANLKRENENHILPFLWIHGEDGEVLRKKLQQIKESGIHAVCVEARPHEDFNGPRWFEDLGTILDECKKRGMKMWLLDDSHFPTGFANGEVKKNYPELQKKYLCLKTYDFTGPINGSGAILKYALRSPDDLVLGVYLQKQTGFEQVDVSQTIDVTDSLRTVKDFNTGRPLADLIGRPVPGVGGETEMVSFDLPEGDWSLNVLTVSFKGGEKETEGYLNPIVPEATDILLNTVYQPVYDHFKEEFGKTFMGFFSDEPRFGNIHGSEHASIGRNSSMNLPWRDDMVQLLIKHCQKLGGILADLDEEKLRQALPLLFINGNDEENRTAHALRYAYIDLVSRLYSDNFDGRIAKWCHDHNCQRIGHCIEDNGAGARLGYGTGHIFRAMAHADMAGIDVVIHQLMPQRDKGLFKGMHSPGWDGRMFTYLLGSIGGSMAHLNPANQGRCMCELFGAYGWAEGNRLMKWLADYMLVRGVNYLVPHAFDAKEFPDADCPPHFNADGHNPQYPEFRILMDYINRIASLLSDSTAHPDVALFFNAEGEWSGDYMPSEDAAKTLAENFVTYDLVTADYLADAKAENGKLKINGVEFNALIFPWARSLPEKLLKDIGRLSNEGVEVIFVNEIPSVSSQGSAVCLYGCKTLTLAELGAYVKERHAVLKLDHPETYLRSYHYSRRDCDLYFFVNENASKRVNVSVSGIPEGNTYEYDAFSNRLYRIENVGMLDLAPYESRMIVITKEEIREAEERIPFKAEKTITLSECSVSLKEHGNDVYSEEFRMDTPAYISGLEGYQTFAGRIRYRFRFVLDETGSRSRIVLDGVREAAGVTVNGKDAGTRIIPDYVFETDALKIGENIVEIELNTTLGRAMNDFLSSFMPVEPTGMTGIRIEIEL